MFDAVTIKRNHESMKQRKIPFQQMQMDSARLILPRQSNFQNITQLQSNVMEDRIFDEYAQQSFETGVSLMEAWIMPRGQLWQRWELSDSDLMKSQRNREWVEIKNRTLSQLRNDPKSGFTGQTHESIASLLGLGMQSMWPDIRRDITGKAVGLSYKSEFIGQIYIKEDHQGLVNHIHYEFPLRAEQAAAKWKDDAPDPVKKAIRDGNPDHEIRFIHVIQPNLQYNSERLDWKGKPWAGCYYCMENSEVFIKGGYRTLPRIVSRFINAPNEDYGRCPAFTILPAIEATQQMRMDLMLASELSAMPPMGAHDDMMDQVVRYAAHEVTYGAIDHHGNRMLQPLYQGSDMSWAFQLVEQLHKAIDRAFFVDMLQIRKEMKSHVTDSQLYQREEEKGMLLAPLANQETEWLSPMLDREIDLMDELGLFEDMPPEIAEALDDGVTLSPVYDNGITRAQDAGAAAGYWTMLEQFGPIFQNDQEAWQQFRQKYPMEKVMDNMGRINGIPASWEATNEEREDRRKSDEDAAALENVIAALPNIAKSSKDLTASQPEQVVI